MHCVVHDVHFRSLGLQHRLYAAVCAIVACALAGPHVPVSWVPPASVGAAAVVLVVIAFVVLAGGKEKQ